jgi:hypothetical protein
MKLRAIAATAVAFGGLAVPAAILAPPSAQAAGGFTICEVNGNKYCLGSSDLNLGTAVTERKPGRNFTLVRVGTGEDGLPTYEIASSTAINSCVAAYGNTIVFHSCSNGDQVVWEMVISDKGNTEWLDNGLAAEGERWFLGGNNNGTQFRLSQEGDGGFIQFNK